MFTILTPTTRATCASCGYPTGECSGACQRTRPPVDPAPTVLTRSAITRLGLQNNVARRLRKDGCRVLCCSALDQPRLSIQIAPPPVHHKLRLAPTRVQLHSEAPRFEAWQDSVRVWWLADDDLLHADARGASHAA